MEIKTKKHKVKRKKLRKPSEEDDKFSIKNNKSTGSKSFKAKNKHFKKVEVSKELIAKHTRGEGIDVAGVKTPYFQERIKQKEKKQEYITEHTARTEILLTEPQGFLEADEGEHTAQYRQSEIVANVDIAAATKHFQLHLDFGPYVMRYTKNGRHLLLGGKKGHVAAFDWITKRLHCEMNVMEEVADVSWLHVETLFACAQKEWVYIYDNQGKEIHCVKRLYKVNKMEFLPYHFLLATASSRGYAAWLDISIGELVGNFNTKLGDIRIMRSNPANGVLCIGGGNGVVSMWSPKVREPIAKMLTHSTPMSSLTVDPKGIHLVTGGLDRTVKVWDIRKLDGPTAIYKLQTPANEIEVSQRGVLALAMGNRCEMYSNIMIENKNKPYLRQRCGDFIHGMRFCSYEDVLGISTSKGFQSILVPGSGEPNYDAFEDNPYQTKTQRREREVHALLEKIPAELITLDPTDIIKVDVDSLEQRIEAKKDLFYLKPPKIDFKPRNKMKGRGGSAKASKNKQIVKDINRKEFITELRKNKKQIIQEHLVESKDVAEDFIPLESKPTALDRFRTKKKSRL